MSALIRSEFKIDPKKLSEDEFQTLGADAIWVNEFRVKNFREAVRDGALEAYVEVLKAKNK